jgi:hypothetical protein
MAHAPSLTRSDRASGIVTRQECEPLDNGAWRVRDTATGSGEWHTTTFYGCDCWDYRRRGGVCKHMRAIILEEAALAEYASSWSSMVDQARAAVEPQGAAYKGQWYTGAQLEASAQARQLRCTTCNGHAESLLSYCGGRGHVTWAVCTVDSSHPARRLA